MGGTADGFRCWDFAPVFFRQRFRLLAARKCWLSEGGKYWPFDQFGWFPPAFSLFFSVLCKMGGLHAGAAGPCCALVAAARWRTKRGIRVTLLVLTLSVAFWVKNGEKTPERGGSSLLAHLSSRCAACVFVGVAGRGCSGWKDNKST